MSKNKNNSQQDLLKEQRDFVAKAGPLMKPMTRLMDSLNWTAVTIKDLAGHILFVNSFYLNQSGRKSADEVLGHTADDFPKHDLLAAYAEEERKVAKTGIPYMQELQKDLQTVSMNFVVIYPTLSIIDGKAIGTTTYYYCDRETIPSASRYDSIKKSLFYINDHIAEPLTIPELAKLAACSESKYRKLFAELTLVTPGEYIVRGRVNLAKSLLSSTDNKISDIANQTGFYDQSHFIHAFKRLIGVTPTAFRRKIVEAAKSR